MRAERNTADALAEILNARTAILYDFDGVLVDSEPFFYLSNNEAFRRFGHRLDRKEYWRHWTNNGTGLDGELRRHGLTLTASDRRWIEERRAVNYRGHIASGKIRFIGDSYKTIALFKRLKKKVIIASNSDPADLAEIFGVNGRNRPLPIVGRSPGLRPKPFPDIFLRAARTLRVKPERCLVIEDALKGLKAAKAAGMACAIIRNRYNRGIDFGDADVVFGSYAAFLAATEACLKNKAR